MLSSVGRFVFMFNGEVYNQTELRVDHSSLGGWRGTSDTDTVLTGFEFWGVRDPRKNRWLLPLSFGTRLGRSFT